MKVAAVVVTYNRSALLSECIGALLSQSVELGAVFVVNNNSTDDTSEVLARIHDEKLHVIDSKTNLGGAGGFCLGIKSAVEQSDCDFVWVMDDDTIPTSTALQRLVEFIEHSSRTVGFVCSSVVNAQNQPMNVPIPKNRKNFDSQAGAIELQAASFVSIMFNRDAILSLGLPMRKYFIWFDDVEYTHRITAKYQCYLIKASRVVHKTVGGNDPDIVTDDARTPRYFYFYRNKASYYKLHFGFGVGILLYFLVLVRDSARILVSANHKTDKLNTLFKGATAGFSFSPKIEYIHQGK